MSNTSDTIYDPQAGDKIQCRMAYTMNNFQPVLCSIVSDQPLFYMDFGDEIEMEEELDDYFDFASIENGVADLERKIKALDTPMPRDAMESDTEDTVTCFLDDAAFVTRPYNKADHGTADIKFLEKALCESRLAAEYLNFAKSFETRLHYDREVATAVYNRQDNQIYINPHLDRADQILLAARELRRVWQHRNGALLHPLTFHPDQAILVHRAQIADLTVNMVRVAWELQLAGEKDAWDRLEASSMTDLARAFARESYLDFRTLNNGVAASAVFETWFLSERVRHEDKKLIQQMLADYQGYVFDSEQSSQNVTAELVIALGTMPFGKNYLAPYVNTIVSDAVFTEIRDRSNANFLWFIKFERSFRETEQHLQTSDVNKSHDKNHSGILNETTRFGDHETENTIVHLPYGESQDASDAKKYADGAGNIIQFRGDRGKA